MTRAEKILEGVTRLIINHIDEEDCWTKWEIQISLADCAELAINTVAVVVEKEGKMLYGVPLTVNPVLKPGELRLAIRSSIREVQEVQ